MNVMKTVLGSVFAVFMAVVATPALAVDVTHSTPGISGYDPVAYFTDGKPMKGSGYHVAEHKGVTYAFASKEHKNAFEANPEKYVPAYGGYCAYGVAVGKKFVSDPEAWKIVQGKLYLNLDKDIQSKWAKDIPGYIKKSEANWKEIKDKAPSDL
ncbi:MAG: YHS domain-containing (seleno)protein [Nitrospirales bacterium]